MLLVGIAQIVSKPYPDPKGDDDRLAVVDVKPKSKLAQPVTLATTDLQEGLTAQREKRAPRFTGR